MRKATKEAKNAMYSALKAKHEKKQQLDGLKTELAAFLAPIRKRKKKRTDEQVQTIRALKWQICETEYEMQKNDSNYQRFQRKYIELLESEVRSKSSDQIAKMLILGQRTCHIS